MAHFEDALFAGISDKLACEGMKYDIGDKVFVTGYASEFVFEVVRCERIFCCGEEKRTYDLVNKTYDTHLHDIPEYRLRLCKAGTRNRRYGFAPFVPKKVIFNDPATIVLWDDDTKTVVKCSEGDTYDPEKGFMLCYLKRLMGKSYYKFISKTVKKYKED